MIVTTCIQNPKNIMAHERGTIGIATIILGFHDALLKDRKWSESSGKST